MSTGAKAPRFQRARTLAALALLVGVIPILRQTYHTLQIAPVEAATTLEPYTDTAESERVARDVVGTFITGERPGDRIIVIEAPDRIRFGEIGAPGPVAPEATTFRLGRIGKTPLLATEKLGTVHVVGFDALVYYGDHYYRTKHPPAPSDPSAPPPSARRPARAASRRRR